MLLSGTYASIARSSHDFQVVKEKRKPLSALHISGGSTLGLHGCPPSGHSNPLSQFPADLLRATIK